MKKLLLIAFLTFLPSTGMSGNFFNDVGETITGNNIDGVKHNDPIEHKHGKARLEYMKQQDEKRGEEDFAKWHKEGHLVYVAGSELSYKDLIEYYKSRGAKLVGTDYYECNNIWVEGKPRGQYCLKTHALYLPPNMSVYTPNSHIPHEQF